MKHPQAKLVIGNTEIGEHKTFFVPLLVFKCEHVTLKHALIVWMSNVHNYAKKFGTQNGFDLFCVLRIQKPILRLYSLVPIQKHTCSWFKVSPVFVDGEHFEHVSLLNFY